MKTLEFEMGEATLQLQQVGGNVIIKGWDRDVIELATQYDIKLCDIEQRDNELVINSRVPLVLNAPRHIAANIGEVNGNLVLHALDGPVSIETVRGDCFLRFGAGDVSINNVRGNLSANRLEGSLSVVNADANVYLSNVKGEVGLGQVLGNVRAQVLDAGLKMGIVQGKVRVRHVNGGAVILEECGRKFKGIDLRGGMEIGRVRRKLSLKSVLTPGAKYVGNADGKVSVRIPINSSARFTLEAHGILTAQLPQIEEREVGRVVGQIGDGEAEVVLRAGRNMKVKTKKKWKSTYSNSALDYDYDSVNDMFAEIEEQLAAQLDQINLDPIAQRKIEKAMRKVDRKLAKAMKWAERGGWRADKHISKAQRKAEKALRRAQRKAEKAARRARKKKGRAGRKSRRWNIEFNMGNPDFGNAKRGSQATEEEQLNVLQMLQDKKISVQEAEKLLKALGS